MIDSEFPVFPIRVNNKWPAIILAVSRTASVPGRITFLIVSIHTMKGMRIPGVPWGTKCANICWVLLIHPYNINEIHRGRANVKVNVRCLVLVKIYGNKPKKLLNKINVNNEIKINVHPFILLGPSRVLNSLWRVNKTIFHKVLNRFGRNQNE